MLGVKEYDQAYVDACRARVDAQIDAYRALAGQGGMEVGTLTFDGELAAYVVAFDDGHSYRVMDGRFVSAWARYSPGRLLETAVLQRMIDDPAKTTLDWMTSIAPESLLVANHVERVVTMRSRVDPYGTQRP